MDSKELLNYVGAFLAGGIVTYAVTNAILPRFCCIKQKTGVINESIEKDKAKIANCYDIEDLDDKVAFCRCWKSSKFPYCDGTHNAHNKLTGDNVGPVVLSRKQA